MKDRLLGWAKGHKLDIFVISILLVITGTVSGINMAGYPQRFEDEGTYVSQAYAVQKRQALAHYTYWYDHPPVGWIQIAAYTTVTDAFDRYKSAVSAGREFMLVLHLATIGLLYALARRLKLGVIASSIGTLLYILSPLAVEFSRYVLLDNVALPWLLGAFILALSPRRSLTAAIGTAFCMAMAILSKETYAVFLPILLYALWQTSDKRNRRYTFTTFGVVFLMVGAAYVLYAALKNELFPGEGHVSLIGTLLWQLFGREGSGSLFDPVSGTRGLISYWLNIDTYLVAGGAVAAVIALFYRNLRVIALSLLVGLVLLLRPGYLPYPYVIAFLPFAALSIAGVLHHLVIVPLSIKTAGKSNLTRRLAAGLAAVALIGGLIVFVIPSWQPKLQALTTIDNDASSRQAVEWIDNNIGRDNRLVVESGLWTDLENKGFAQPQPVWLYKTETDPEVTKEIGGWRGIDYVILNDPTLGIRNFDKAFPTVSEAIEHGQIVTQFGTDNQKIVVYKINH